MLRDGEAKEGCAKPGSDSWMNVTFEVVGEGGETKFLTGAEKEGIKGHRYGFLFPQSPLPQNVDNKSLNLYGVIRISLYNAVTEERERENKLLDFQLGYELKDDIFNTGNQYELQTRMKKHTR